MAELNPEKIVDFHEYCPECKYYDRSERDDPCFDCLDEPVNVYSHRPVHFKEKDKK